MLLIYGIVYIAKFLIYGIYTLVLWRWNEYQMSGHFKTYNLFLIHPIILYGVGLILHVILVPEMVKVFNRVDEYDSS